MRSWTKACIALAVFASIPAATEAQRRPFVLSPEYAASAEEIGSSLRLGAAVKTFNARLNIRPHKQLSPWLAAGVVARGSSCQGRHCESDGWLLVPGVRLDALGGPHNRGVRPYVLAGAGMFVEFEESPKLLPSAGAGVRWSERNTFAPRLEVRWERYNSVDYAMLSVGFGFVFGSSVSAIER